MIIFVFTGLEYTRQFKKKKNTQKFHGLIMDVFCNALCRQSRVIFCAFIGLNSNKIMLTEFPVLFVNLKSLSVNFVAVTVLKYALRHINKNTTVHFLWYWILCISLQFKRNFDFDFTDTLMLYQRQRAPCLLYIDLTMIKKNTCGSRIIYTWAFIKRHNIGFFFLLSKPVFFLFPK